MTDIDLVVFGATGFTGSLVADYLATRLKGTDTRWALAGRNRSKLEAVRARLAGEHPHCEALPLIEAASDDDAALRQMAQGASVVLSTVGPYAGRGERLVEACVETGTDYVDITGEPVFWRAVIDRFHDRAVDRAVLIVPCCGFDSIPHDLGAWFAARELAAKGPVSMRGYVRVSGTVSGGTFNTFLAAVADLGASRKASRGSGGARPKIHFAKELKRWAVPMPTIDPLVVRRSAQFCADFGSEFRYEHYLQVRGVGQMAKLLAGVGALVGLSQIPMARRWLGNLRPAGTGPSEEERANAHFTVTLFAEGDGRHVRAEVTGGDPGYGQTSKMVAEAALTLVEDRDQLPHAGGVLTPASALAPKLIDRLRGSGMGFSIAP